MHGLVTRNRALHSRMPITRYLSYVTVEPVLFLYMMAIFIESTALRGLMSTKACLRLHNHSLDDCSNHTIVISGEVVDVFNLWNKYYDSAMFACTLLVSFYVASWSDYLGRKAIMIISPVGTIIASLINMILSACLTADISYFFISAIISGLSFGTLGVIASTFGYISDIVPEQYRTKRILILELMIFSGSTLGTYICGEFLQNVDLHSSFNQYVIIFVFELGLAVVTLIYILLRIPFGVPSGSIISLGDLSFPAVFSLSHLKKVKETVFKRRPEGRREKILLLILSLILIYYGLIVQFTISYQFVEKKLGWRITDFSRFSSTQKAIEGTAFLVLLPFLFYELGIGDYTIAVVGILSRALGLMLLGLSYSPTLIYSSAILSIFSEFPVPTVRSMLSKLVDQDERGKIFAFTTISQNFCFFSGGFLFPTLFHLSRNFFPGLCFEIVSGLQLIAIIILCVLWWKDNIVTVHQTFRNDDGNVIIHNEENPILHDEISPPHTS